MKNEILKDINKIITNLIFSDPVIGYFTSMLNLYVVKEGIPLAAVALDNKTKNFTLIIREDEWFNHSPKIRQGVIEHEIMHILYCHLTDLSYLSKNGNHKLANIATDLEINQYIKEDRLPSWGLFIDQFRKEYPELNLPPKQGSVFYFNELKKIKQDITIDPFAQHTWGDGNMLDENGNPVELDEATRDYIKDNLQSKIDQVVKEARNAGHNTSKYDHLVRNFVKEKPVFNYKKHLKTFIENSTEYYVKKSYFKVNARFEDSPKVVLKPKGKILVLVDESGSVGEGDLIEGLNEIHHIAKDTPIEIRAFDTEIKDVVKYDPRKKIYQRTACGGTDFQICVDYFESRKDISTCIVFTDGEAHTPKNTLKNMLWVVVPNGTLSSLKGLTGGHKILKMPQKN